MKVGEIATANNISDPAKIHPGMELIIPGWQTPAGKAAGKSGAKGAAKAAAEPAKPVSIPTISVGDDAPAPAKAGSDAPPTITVEDAPAPKKP